MTAAAPDGERNARLVMHELSAALAGVDTAAAGGIIEKILHRPSVFIGGAGRSGLLMRCFAMRLMHLGIRCHVVGDTATPAISSRDLLIVGSGSGETSGMIAICGKAREKGAAIALITANAESTCAGLADEVVAIPAGGSLQPLGCLFEQTMFLFLETMVLELMAATGQSGGDMARRHANLE